jgi:hypothetical protein
MRRPTRLLIALLLPAVLVACHNDPFSVKPEVPGVKIPKQTAPPEAPAEEEEDAADTPVQP